MDSNHLRGLFVEEFPQPGKYIHDFEDFTTAGTTGLWDMIRSRYSVHVYFDKNAWCVGEPPYDVVIAHKGDLNDNFDEVMTRTRICDKQYDADDMEIELDEEAIRQILANF
jgi:hypothetical protein